MTVSELLEKLRALPQDADVVVRDTSAAGFHTATVADALGKPVACVVIA